MYSVAPSLRLGSGKLFKLINGEPTISGIRNFAKRPKYDIKASRDEDNLRYRFRAYRYQTLPIHPNK